MLSHCYFILPSTISLENASVQHSGKQKTFIRHFVVCFLTPKKATCHYPESLPNLIVAVFNICCNCVNTFAEQALLGCADRSESKIITVIIFHRLLLDGKFHLACEFACSEIGQRSRWLWKKKTKTKRAGSQTPVLLIRLSPFQQGECSHPVRWFTSAEWTIRSVSGIFLEGILWVISRSIYAQHIQKHRLVIHRGPIRELEKSSRWAWHLRAWEQSKNSFPLPWCWSCN